ncbi:hypothetical protein [Endozoicomonas sp.]|uniref:hypothetical protein n=1 Tax=Endozoicomonas sp. TaxID=1892382 RepID=UPI003AF75463
MNLKAFLTTIRLQSKQSTPKKQHNSANTNSGTMNQNETSMSKEGTSFKSSEF